MRRTSYLPNKQYSFQVVDDLQEFEKLRNVWDNLAEKHDSYFPFLCFDWFKVWLKHFLKDNKLFVLLLCNKDEIKMIAPLFIKKEKVKGINVRKIKFIGNLYSPIQTFLFQETDSELKEKNVDSVLKFLCQMNQRWDVIDLQSVPVENGTFNLLQKAVSKIDFRTVENTCFYNWYTDGISYTSALYFKNRSRNLRASIKKNFKKAKDTGSLKFNILMNNNDLHKHIDLYFGVYQKSWKQREGLGPDFLSEWIKITSQRGWLRFGIVSLNDSPISAGFAVVCNRHVYLQKSSYDKNYSSFGPGSIWLSEMIKYAIDNDSVSEIDFLKGNEEYKKLWAEKIRERKGIYIFNNNLKGKILYLLMHSILPTINKNNHLRAFKKFISKFT
jgi:CelD/BcsL family acetyltransferase involved in cellulose biosynthesis